MAEATIKSQTEVDPKSFQENALPIFTVDANFQREKAFFVHMYNMGARAHRVSNGLIKNALIPGCPAGQPYVKAFSLGSPVQQAWQDPDTGMLRTYGEDARRVMMDLINPANIGIDQDREFRPEEIVSQGANISVWGVFWSLNDPPAEEEVSKARKRMEKWYRHLLTEADTLSTLGKRAEILEYHHVAAEHFKYRGQGDWHVAIQAPETCPNCGDSIKAGAAYHRTSDGMLCVVDWKRTVDAGVKTKKDVPAGKEWWEVKTV